MSWRRHSYSGAGLPRAPVPAARAPPLLFPSVQPHGLLDSPLDSSLVGVMQPSSPTAAGAAPSPQAAPEPPMPAAAVADEEQVQSMLSALRVALAKKEAALVSVAGQLADVQARLEGAEADRRGLAARVHELEAAGAVTSKSRMPQTQRDLGQEAAAAAQLAAERDALQRDVLLLQQQLMAAAQAEAQERERLAAEAAQSRLLARARARQVQQLQAELAAAASSMGGTTAAASQRVEAACSEAAAAAQMAAEANARAAAAEAEAAELRQQVEAAQQACCDAESRAAAAEGTAAEAAQQTEWQALRIGELEATSSVGQLMRKYEGEVQRLRAQFEADRRELQQQLAQARQQAAAAAVPPATPAPAPTQAVGLPQQASQNSAAWAALFDEPEISQSAPAEVWDACVQTEPAEEWADPALLEAARLEIERLQHVAAELLESQTAGQQALEHALARQREAELARDNEAAGRAATATEQQLALDAARRAEAGLRERLGIAESQLAHQGGEVRALREANEKLDLALAALREELEAARQVQPAQLEQLQMELRAAAAHTDALEAQVQQLKQQAAAAVEEHEAAVRQQAQEGALDAAEQVAAAVQAAAQRHGEEVQALEAQLADVQHQLLAGQTELLSLRQAQAVQQARMVEVGVQVGSPAAASQHDGTQTHAVAEPAPFEALPARAPGMLLQQRPSKGGSACAAPATDGFERLPPAPAASLVQTAAQLQLELAKVKLTPLKPLIGGSLAGCGTGAKLAASGISAKPPPSPCRLGSAFGELGSTVYEAAAQQPLPGRSSLSSLVGRRHASGVARSNSSSCSRLATEDEDACFATPLAHTPAALSPELSPCGSMLAPAAAGHDRPSQQELPQDWPGQDQQQQQQQQQQQRVQARRQGPPVPPLALQRVRPYTSLSCDSSWREEQPLRCSSAGGASSGGGGSWAAPSAEASVPSIGSLSSLGPSASQLGGVWTPAAGAGTVGGAGSLLQLPQDCSDVAGRSPATGSGLGSSWQSAALDASLARLAVLTAGLTASSSRRRG